MEQESNKVSTILQCFVDTNLELNEYYPYRTASLNEVYFPDRGLSVPENTSVPIKLKLAEPSTQGIETVTVGFIPLGATLDDVNVLLPQTFVFEVGEQEKTIFVEVVKDFYIEIGETFQIAITSAFNVLPRVGSESVSIAIEDTTVLRRVSFAQNENGFLLPYWNGAQNIDYLTYEVGTFTYPTLRVALDQASESGIEKVNVSIYRGVTDPEFVSNLVVSFAQGEQYKDILLSNIPPVVLNNSDVLLVKLFPTTNNITELTASLNFDNGYTEALLYVNAVDSGVQRKFTTVNLRDIFRQKGATIDNNPIQLRTVKYNDGLLPELSDAENNWLLRFGDTYKDFTDYEDGYPFQPTYKFGLDFNGVPSELTLLVRNIGDVAVDIDGETYNPGDVYETQLTSNNFQLTLPSNAGFSQDPSDFSQFQEFNTNGIYTETAYEFSVRNNGQTYFNINSEETTYYRHSFVSLDEQGGTNITMNFGPHNLTNFASNVEALSSPQYMATRYADVLTRYNGGECTNSFTEPENLFNIRMLGLILLDGSDNQTTYQSTEFIPLEEFDPICGEFHSETTDPDWKGIEFDLPGPTGPPDVPDQSDVDVER